MLIPSMFHDTVPSASSLSRRVNANSQRYLAAHFDKPKLIKKGEC